MNELFEKIYAASNINTEESKQTELFEQIYKEAEMLNEMNPKLRAMLLGGALAAGLGMQSCSMLTDPSYDPPVIEQPAPTEETPTEETPTEETPTEETPETLGETPDNPDNPGETPKPTLESMFDTNATAHINRLKDPDNICLHTDNISYSQIFGNLATYEYYYGYDVTNNKFSLLPNDKTGNFTGYIILNDDINDESNSYAYFIPGDADTVTLFNELLPINLQ